MTKRDRDKAIALLKSLAADCENNLKNDEHSWRRCRHCLAIAECESTDARLLLGALAREIE